MCNTTNDGGGGGGPMRKGPWTEQEDAQLVWFVRLFGERRWDFLAKVSGLRRTGKSCRLRWVNYLHPGLKRGRITADEERLILHLHAQWGGRWSRIARKLPGRTDNEIKNFWRTHTRKLKLKPQDTSPKKKPTSPSSSSSSLTSSSASASASLDDGATAATSSASAAATTDTEALQESSSGSRDEATTEPPPEQFHFHHSTMDQLWNEIAADETYAAAISWGAGGHFVAAEPSSPVWESCTDYSLWRIDDEEYYKKMLDAS